MHAKYVAMIACGCLQSYYVSAALCNLVTHRVSRFWATPRDMKSYMMKTVLTYAWEPLGIPAGREVLYDENRLDVCLGTLSC